MPEHALLAEIGALVGDPTRARMLVALLDGRALTASELAAEAGITPQTASGHLARLTATGLIAMRQQGRHRYHALATAEVARMLEGMMQVVSARRGAAGPPGLLGTRDAALRAARTCYDHLAGRLGVSVADALAARRHIRIEGDGAVVTRSGDAFLRDLGVDLQAAQRTRRVLCRTCLDWTERRIHLAGALGAALLERSLELRWVRRMRGTRALAVTVGGAAGFRKMFGFDPARGG